MSKMILTGLIPAAILLSGCEKPMEAGHLVGQWVGADGAQLELKEGSGFSVRGLPYKIFDNPITKGHPISGTGRWSVSGSWHSGYEVRLYLLESDGRAVRREIRLLVSGSRNSPGLYQWVGDEGGERYELTRKVQTQ